MYTIFDLLSACVGAVLKQQKLRSVQKYLKKPFFTKNFFPRLPLHLPLLIKLHYPAFFAQQSTYSD